MSKPDYRMLQELEEERLWKIMDALESCLDGDAARYLAAELGVSDSWKAHEGKLKFEHGKWRKYYG